MFSRRWYIAPLVLILIVGLLGAGGYAIHRAGWMQGYAMGQLATAGKETASMPWAARAFGPWGHGYRAPFFGHSPFRSGFSLVIGIVVLMLAAKCMAYLLFGRHVRHPEWAAARKGRVPFEGMPGGMPMHGPAGRARARRWHRMHCQMSPRFYEDEEEPGEDKGQAAQYAPEASAES